MDRLRFVLVVVFSALILIGWPVVMHRFFPQPAEETQSFEPSQIPPATNPQQPTTPQQAASPGSATAAKQIKTAARPVDAKVEPTAVAEREITIDLPDKTFK